jgi:hypothetical protein
LFLFIPFGLAFLALMLHQYKLDPVLVFLNRSESIPSQMLGVKKPYVRKLLLGRVVWVAVLMGVLTAAVRIVFWVVPGHRL